MCPPSSTGTGLPDHTSALSFPLAFIFLFALFEMVFILLYYEFLHKFFIVFWNNKGV